MTNNFYYRFIRNLFTKKDEQNQLSGGLWPRMVREAAADTCRGLKGKIIELGCGEGLFLEKAAKNNPDAEVLGVDFWKEAIEIARNRLKSLNNIHLLHIKASETDLKNDSFDYCFCINTLLNQNSIEDIEKIFLEARRILKIGGKFVFEIRNSFSPIIQLQYKLVKFYDPGITVPVKFYSPKKIEILLNKCGFTSKNRMYIGFPNNIFSPAVLFKVEKI